jgi:hypothetical protein
MFYSTGTQLDNSIDIERNYRLLKVCYVPAFCTTFLGFFAAVATNSAYETNKTGSM